MYFKATEYTVSKKIMCVNIHEKVIKQTHLVYNDGLELAGHLVGLILILSISASVLKSKNKNALLNANQCDQILLDIS